MKAHKSYIDTVTRQFSENGQPKKVFRLTDNEARENSAETAVPDNEQNGENNE